MNALEVTVNKIKQKLVDKIIFLVIISLTYLGCKVNPKAEVYYKSLEAFPSHMILHFPKKIDFKKAVSSGGYISSKKNKISLTYSLHLTIYDSIDARNAFMKLSESKYKIAINSSDSCNYVIGRFLTSEKKEWEKYENNAKSIKNKCEATSLPIPNFSAENEFMKLLFNENKNLVVEKNNDIVEFKKDEIDFQLPDDFQIYVLDAQKGNYYNEEFPSRWIELTGEWKHGYSKGYAYSTKRNIIIYWAEIW